MLLGLAITLNFIGIALALIFFVLIIKEYLDSNTLDSANLIFCASSIVVIILSCVLLNLSSVQESFKFYLPEVIPTTTPSPSPSPSSSQNPLGNTSATPLPGNTPINTAAASITDTQSPAVTIPPAVTYSLTKKNINIISLTTPISRGSFATLTAKVLPNTEYTINFYYPYIIPDLGAIDDSIDNGSEQVSSSPTSTPKPVSVIPDGLGKKTSDASGLVTWSWYIGYQFKPGTYPVIVSNSQNYDAKLLEIK